MEGAYRLIADDGDVFESRCRRFRSTFPPPRVLN